MIKHNLIVEKVSKRFPSPDGGDSLEVLEDISLNIEQGAFISILGPSGCGKSTLLNFIAGFEAADKGQVIYEGERIKEPSSERAMVFQSAVLFPWLTVKGNIAYGLKRKGETKKNIQIMLDKYIKKIGLEGFEDYYPHQLSGGMQQRVALARVLILNPQILLMDEPFAALDALSRLNMQQLLLSIWRELKPTIIFVTHDVEEALFLADRVFVLSKRPGKIIRELQLPFSRPRSLSLTGDLEFSRLKREVLNILISQENKNNFESIK